MYVYSLSRSLALSLSRSLDTDGWIPTRVGRRRRGRRRAVQTVADISSFVVMSNVTPNVSTSFSLSKRALNAPGGVRPTSRRRGSNNSFAAFLRVVLRFEREKYSSSSRRRKRGQNHTTSAGKNQLQNPLSGAVNVVFKTRAKGAASRATGRNGASWKSSWTRAPSRAFARYV